ncbi:hypothetical protein H4W33_007453 [Kibdelosporangium phytohabitans]|nr:hypothetical protein [Kibdelosporangium phytohabitans]
MDLGPTGVGVFAHVALDPFTGDQIQVERQDHRWMAP